MQCTFLHILLTVSVQDEMPTYFTSSILQFKWPQSWNASAKRCISAGARQLEHHDEVSGAKRVEGVLCNSSKANCREIHAELETGLELPASQLGEVAR